MAARGAWRHLGRELGTSRGNVASALANLNLSLERPIFEKCLRQRGLSAPSTSGEIRSIVRSCESVACRAVKLSPVSKAAACSLQRSFWRPGNVTGAMQLSILRGEETIVSESESSRQESVAEDEDLSSTRLARESVQEFIPEGEDIPSTPLVQAIQSQEKEYSEELAKSVEPRDGDLSSDFGFSSDGITSPLPTVTDREIQPDRVYLGGLPFAVKGDELKDGIRELCSKYGHVLDITLAQHQHQSQKSILSGKHRGFAFVTMETSEQARDVINNLNCTSAFGRIILVSHGLKILEPPKDLPKGKGVRLPRCKLFVGNLNDGTTREVLMKRFEEYGKVVDCKLIGEVHSNKSRGFAFISFAEEAQAMKAILDLDGTTLDGSIIKVNIAKYPQTY